MPKYILFLAKLKGEEKPFWNGKSWTYSMNYLLHVLSPNVNYCKSVDHPIPTRENRELLGKVYSLLSQTEGERKVFLGDWKKGSHIVRVPPRALVCHKR